MNSYPVDLNTSTVQLTSSQLIRIFEQLGCPDAQISPYSQVYLQLEPFQIQSVSTSAIVVPVSTISRQPTVESIISTTSNNNIRRINPAFIGSLADRLQITRQEFIDVIQDPRSGNIRRMTQYLNTIFNNTIDPPLTEQEVREIVLITLPSYR